MYIYIINTFHYIFNSQTKLLVKTHIQHFSLLDFASCFFSPCGTRFQSVQSGLHGGMLSTIDMEPNLSLQATLLFCDGSPTGRKIRV